MKTTTDSKPDQTGLGIAIILASVVTMAFADAVVKLFSSDLSVWQIFVTRSLFGILALGAVLFIAGVRFRVLSLNWVIIRSTLLVLTWLVYYASFPLISLSVAAVAVYTNPIITTLLSAMLVGEKVTGRQWLGVMMGFLGVIAILKPGGDAFSWAVMLPLFAALLYSLSMIITRTKCQDEEPLVLGLYLHISFVVIGTCVIAILATVGIDRDLRSEFPFLLEGWISMGQVAWGVMAILGILSAAYFVGVARAYQIAPTSIIATFDYVYLVSAAVWSVVLFSEKPDAYTILGMILITIAGLLVAVRKRKTIS